MNKITDEGEPLERQVEYHVKEHLEMTYPGICSSDESNEIMIYNKEPESTLREPYYGFCNYQPHKCLHGLLDGQNLQKNVRLLNQYYDKQMGYDTDFDERYFINLNGLSRTPLKLINSISPTKKSPSQKEEI